jgi:hypothetical protein
MVASSVTDSGGARPTGPLAAAFRPAARARGRTAAACLADLLVVLSGVLLFERPASAWDWTPGFQGPCEPSPPSVESYAAGQHHMLDIQITNQRPAAEDADHEPDGLAAAREDVGPAVEQSYKSRGIKPTTYELYGQAGTTFTTWEGGCVNVVNGTGGFVANMLFDTSKTVTALGLSVYQWSSSDAPLGPLLDEQPHVRNSAGKLVRAPSVIDQIAKGGNGRKGLRQVLYLDYFAVFALVGIIGVQRPGFSAVFM